MGRGLARTKSQLYRRAGYRLFFLLEDYMLDIIIPTYKNKELLIQSLKSIPNYKEVVVTVIDDCSNLDYSDIREQFNINFLELGKNVGPGIARQIGIEYTHQPYILFLDSGDYFYPNALDEVIGVIKINPMIDIFSWKYFNAESEYKEENNNLHGRVYKREFLRKYNICFCEESSYANEDVGFNHICRLVSAQYNILNMQLNNYIIVYETNDMNSLTRKNNRGFLYKEQNMGLAINAIHAYNIAKKDGVSEELLKYYLSDIIGSEYLFFIRALEERPEFLQEVWDGARYFYLNLFKTVFEKNPQLDISFKKMLEYYRYCFNNEPKLRLNIKLFIKLLETSEKIPECYLKLANGIQKIGDSNV